MAVDTPGIGNADSAALASQLQALQVAFDTSERKIYEQALEASERRYRDLFDNVLTGVYRALPSGTVTLANPALRRMLGYGPDEQPIITRRNCSTFYTDLFRDGEVRGLESTWVRKDGGYVTVRETARLVKDSNGVTAFQEGVVEDITNEKRAENFELGCRRILEMVARNENLEDVLAEMASLLEAHTPGRTCSITLRRGGRLWPIRRKNGSSPFSDAAIPIRAGNGCCAHAVHARRTILVPNISKSEVFARVHGVARELGIGAAWSTPICSQGEVRGTIGVFASHPVHPDPQEVALVETASRIAAVAIEHRSLYDNLRRQATTDRLTDLPNRFVFEETLAQCLQERAAVGLLWIDLDRFKEVNDTLGHHIGDALIRQVAGRLSECVGRAALLARIGGDEFAVILNPVVDRAHAEECARSVAVGLQLPFHVDDYELYVTASIGISMYPDDGVTAMELQQNADAAMYRAKDRGKNGFAFFEEQLGRSARERLEIETGLRRALQNGELRLYYQPQVDLDGNVEGMEALLRWQHPKRGLLGPGEFIAIAEETGLIVSIGAWVIREACKQCAEWRASGHKDMRVAVNVSALQFYFSDLLDIVRGALDACNLPPDCLELELTESLIMRNSEDSTRELERLRALGVTIAIDDFGTGYSSFSYLRKLPVDVLKIDRSFLQDVGATGSVAVIQAIAAVAHNFGLRVAAEGVETNEQMECVRRVGVDLVQGYLFGKPMPAAQVQQYLQAPTAA